MATATREKKQQQVELKPPVIMRVMYELKGIGRGLVLSNPAGYQGNGSTGGKSRKTPDDEQFEGARYLLDPPRAGATDGIPAVAFIAAMKRQAVNMKQGTAVMGTFWAEPDEDGLLPLLDVEVKPITCFPRNKDGQAPKVIRAHYPVWRVQLPLAYVDSVLNKNEVAQLLLDAGVRVGVGCQRPERDQAAGFGRFTFEVE